MTPRKALALSALVVGTLDILSCARSEPQPRPLPPNSFAFAVFGDGPYRPSESGRFTRLIEDVNGADVAWFLHIGDIFGSICSDAELERTLRALNGIRHPVVYTPGDNEWTDCHRRGAFQPLERLRRIRTLYFAHPSTTIGGNAMPVESQSANPAWKEFVENVRWRRGGFLFVTVHMVGSWNATARFRGRTAADDSAVVRRTAAAIDWLDSAFAMAKADSMSGVVIAMHGDPRFQRTTRNPFATFLAKLRAHVNGFNGQVLLIHGDTHEYKLDRPLENVENFTRLETYGSPDIGWVRVVIDSVAGRVVEFEPRLMHGGVFR